MIACILTRYDQNDRKPIVLTVLDGWGIPRRETKGECDRAGAQAGRMTNLSRNFPNTLIHTSGPYVGLPEGQMGNSEVGHMNMGAGADRAHGHYPDRPADSRTGNCRNVPLFQQAMERGADAAIAFCGIAERRPGVHSHIQHLFALLEMGEAAKKVEKSICALFHGRTRHARPNSGRDYVRQVCSRKMRELGSGGKLRRWWGRYYAMDRDNRWGSAWSLLIRALVHGEGGKRGRMIPLRRCSGVMKRGVTDEFIKPIVGDEGKRSFCRACGADPRRGRRDLFQLPRGPAARQMDVRAGRRRTSISSLIRSGRRICFTWG